MFENSSRWTLFDLRLPDNFTIPESCYWRDVFEDEERVKQHLGTQASSIIGMMATYAVLRKPCICKDDRYRYLLLYFVPALFFRMNLLGGSYLNLCGLQKFCLYVAYIDSFLVMLEIEGLTHACISRFVMARYAAKGWEMNKRLFWYFLMSTEAFAAVYTLLPMFGVGGSYDYDLTCIICGYNMVLPDTPQRYFIVFLFFMRYIKPVLVMTGMLIGAYYLENYKCSDENNAERKRFTSVMMHVACVYMIFCMFLAIERSCVIFSQLFYLDGNYCYNVKFIKLSYWLHAMSPVGVLIIMAIKDEKIRPYLTDRLGIRRQRAGVEADKTRTVKARARTDEARATVKEE